MRLILLSGTALATCHRTGFLNPHAVKQMHRAVIGTWFRVAVLPGIK